MLSLNLTAAGLLIVIVQRSFAGIIQRLQIIITYYHMSKTEKWLVILQNSDMPHFFFVNVRVPFRIKTKHVNLCMLLINLKKTVDVTGVINQKIHTINLCGMLKHIFMSDSLP